MDEKKNPKTKELLNEEQKDRTDEFTSVFNYFENANIRNRDAFAELLNYTMETRRNPHK